MWQEIHVHFAPKGASRYVRFFEVYKHFTPYRGDTN